MRVGLTHVHETATTEPWGLSQQTTLSVLLSTRHFPYTRKLNDNTGLLHRNPHPPTAFCLHDVSRFAITLVLLNNESLLSSRFSCCFWICSGSRRLFSGVVQPHKNNTEETSRMAVIGQSREEMTSGRPVTTLQWLCFFQLSRDSKRRLFGHRFGEPIWKGVAK